MSHSLTASVGRVSCLTSWRIDQTYLAFQGFKLNFHKHKHASVNQCSVKTPKFPELTQKKTCLSSEHEVDGNESLKLETT